MCLTTRDHTMQRGACEALSLGRPIVTSDWPLLRDYFGRGAVHVAATPASIAAGVRRIVAEHAALSRDVVALRDERRAEWAERRGEIARLLGIDNGGFG